MSVFECLVDGAVPSDSDFLYIQSVQPFAITIGTGDTSNTATISSVNTARSVIFFAGFTTTHTGTTQREYRPRVELTNGTTVTAYRDSSSATHTITVRGTVVEFDASMVSSVQHGTITVASGSASGTATISSVSTSRSAVFYLGNTNNTTNTSPANMSVGLTLTNATTVTATRATTGTAILDAGFIVVEFDAAVIASVQQRAVTLSTTATSSTDTISSVSTGNTMLVYGGAYCNSTTHSAFFYNLELTSATAVTLTRTGTASTSRTINYTAVEFVPGVLASVQRGTTAVNNVTSADTTITSVDPSKAVCNSLHFSTNASTVAHLFATVKLLNATTVRGEKNTAGGVNSTPAWEVIEFN